MHILRPPKKKMVGCFVMIIIVQ